MSASDRMAKKRARDKAKGIIDVRVKAKSPEDAQKIKAFAKSLYERQP